MIFTHVGRMGDFVLSWPVASWYYRMYGEKIHFVLSDNFAPFKKIESLLRYQCFTEDVTYVDVGIENNIPSHWMFNPEKFGIEGKYKNFGFPKYPDRYIPEFFAKITGLGCDEEYTIKCPISDKYKNDVLYVIPSTYRHDYKTFKLILKPEYIELDINNDVMENCSYALGAKEVYSNMGGFAAVMDMCNKPITIFELEEVLHLKTLSCRVKHNFIINPKKIVD